MSSPRTDPVQTGSLRSIVAAVPCQRGHLAVLASALGLAFALAAPPGAARAAWSGDAAFNLPVADGSGDQVQPKIAPTADGGCYVSWFDGLGNGFDVRLQRLDLLGNEVFPHEGVLVADRGFSSTQDYGLDVDAEGNALLVFRDDRGSGVQITASKVSPQGGLLWGAGGVQLTATNDFVAAPKIAGTADGDVVVAWTQDVDTHVQRLDATGSPRWNDDVVLVAGVGSYSASDLHDAGDDAILSFVHQAGGFGSPRHLLAQKLDSSGALLWGVDHVAVFESGSLQFGNFPIFRSDGSGGAIFSWYDAATTQLQCYVQRVLANGAEAFPHNGVAVSTAGSRVRVSPSAVFDPATAMTYVFWREQSTNQSQDGVYGQKLDATGARQWTEAGAPVVGLSADEIGSVEPWAVGSGVFVFWDRAPSFGSDRLYGARLTGSGVVDLGPFDVASVPSGKSRLQVQPSAAGFALLAWQDARSDESDVYMQNVNADGSLGLDPSDLPVEVGVTRLLGAAVPNPSAGEVRIAFDPRALGKTESTGLWTGEAAPGGRGEPAPLPGGFATSAWRFEVLDASGRRIEGGPVDPAAGSLLWSGRGADGRAVAPGVYFVRVTGPAGSDVVPITIVR